MSLSLYLCRMKRVLLIKSHQVILLWDGNTCGFSLKLPQSDLVNGVFFGKLILQKTFKSWEHP
jgi:hypothetical protein